jgi:hypothetical protein
MVDMSPTWTGVPPVFTRRKDKDGNEVGGEDLGHYESQWVLQSVRYGREAGVDPRLVLAVLYEEGADSPQPLRPGYDYGRWLNNSVTQKPNGNSLGLANMKEPTFNAVKSAFPKEFEGEEWSETRPVQLRRAPARCSAMADFAR